MKRFAGFFFLAMVVVALWVASVVIVINIYGLPTNAAEAGDMFGGINALFSGLALAGVIFTVWLQSLDVKTNQENLNKSMESNRRSLEIMALSALIQEADSALLRYERWEKTENAGNYDSAKAKVRQALNGHRGQLERLLNDVQSVTQG